jgi:hypothetical protein
MLQGYSCERRKLMTDEISDVSLIARREIEALIAVPLIRAYVEAFGKEKALVVARNVIEGLAADAGKMLAVVARGNSMEHLKQALSLFSQGGAMDIEIQEDVENQTGMNVTRCAYAEMYRKHGMEDLGYLLSCGRDFALVENFNPKITLERTQTIMEGAEFCDFRFTLEDDSEGQR